MGAIIEASVARDGFEGVLFPGDGRKDRVMIVMSGSNGGMKLTRQAAKFYDDHGFPALALALFGTRQTQKCLTRVPVEYVESAIGWLKGQGYGEIGIDGMSKGSEMALVAASMFPQIACVVARVPSHFVSEGLSGSGKGKGPSGTSCWSYRGRDLPYAPYRARKFNLMKMLLKERELHIITFNRDKDVTPESLIPLENIRGPILTLSSKGDAVWPSYESACYMERRLADAGFPYPHRHIAFDHMSHAMLTELPRVWRLAFKAERKDPRACAKERETLKAALLEWANGPWGEEAKKRM